MYRARAHGAQPRRDCLAEQRVVVDPHQHREQLFPWMRDHGGRQHGARTGGANMRALADYSHVTTSLESVVPPDRHRDPVRSAV